MEDSVFQRWLHQFIHPTLSSYKVTLTASIKRQDLHSLFLNLGRAF